MKKLFLAASVLLGVLLFVSLFRKKPKLSKRKKISLFEGGETEEVVSKDLLASGLDPKEWEVSSKGGLQIAWRKEELSISGFSEVPEGLSEILSQFRIDSQKPFSLSFEMLGELLSKKKTDFNGGVGLSDGVHDFALLFFLAPGGRGFYFPSERGDLNCLAAWVHLPYLRGPMAGDLHIVDSRPVGGWHTYSLAYDPEKGFTLSVDGKKKAGPLPFFFRSPLQLQAGATLSHRAKVRALFRHLLFSGTLLYRE